MEQAVQELWPPFLTLSLAVLIYWCHLQFGDITGQHSEKGIMRCFTLPSKSPSTNSEFDNLGKPTVARGME